MDYKTVLAKLHSLANREDESYNMMIMHIRCIPEYRNWFASVVETEKAMRKYQTLMDQAPQVIANNDYEQAAFLEQDLIQARGSFDECIEKRNLALYAMISTDLGRQISQLEEKSNKRSWTYERQLRIQNNITDP